MAQRCFCTGHRHGVTGTCCGLRNNPCLGTNAKHCRRHRGRQYASGGGFPTGRAARQLLLIHIMMCLCKLFRCARSFAGYAMGTSVLSGLALNFSSPASPLSSSPYLRSPYCSSPLNLPLSPLSPFSDSSIPFFPPPALPSARPYQPVAAAARNLHPPLPRGGRILSGSARRCGVFIGPHIAIALARVVRLREDGGAFFCGAAANTRSCLCKQVCLAGFLPR